MVELEKAKEYVLTSEAYTNQELEEKYENDYEEAIEKLGLSRENWENFRKEFGVIRKKQTFETYDEVEEFLKQQLPEEIRYDSDCDGYDACWMNYYHIVETEKGKFLVFEQYFVSANKDYGVYLPTRNATLSHTLKIYRVIGK